MERQLKTKRPKYGAKRTTVDGISFASKAEAKRYGELKLLEKAGALRELLLQPRYPMRVNDRLICTYVGDFQYRQQGLLTCEDVKGVKTDAYKIKRKLFQALYPHIEHREIS